MADRMHKAQVLLVEDDGEVAESVKDGLDARRYEVTHVGSLTGALEVIASNQYDALILDLNLPDGSGIEIARRVRENGSTTPILMLTARNELQQRLEGFSHGADDYICKPFSPAELLARLDAVLRRTGANDGHRLTYADIELNLLKRLVRWFDYEVTLSDREADLLACFMRHPDEPLSRAKLVTEVWGDDLEGGSNVLNVYVNYLRNKLEAGGRCPRLIHTVRGVGYILSDRDVDEKW